MNETAGDKTFLSTRNVSIALAVVLIVAFAGPAFGTSSFFYRDFGVLAYPTASYHRAMFWRGELPLWNPYSNCGVPFLAQWGTMVLYPFTLIYCILPFPWSLNFFCLLHLWFGAVGAMRLARGWTGSKNGAAVAGILFLFNGITLATLSWPNYTVAFAWMPWLILFTDLRARSFTLAAAAGTMQMLAGAPEVTLLTWMLIGARWLLDAIQSPNLRKRMLLCAAALPLIIAALSAAQLLPFFELLSLSQRPAGVDTAKWALPITGLANLLLPMLHAFQTPQGTWFQYKQHFLSSTYLGAAAIFLAAIGVVCGDRKARLLAAATILCMVLALGGAWQQLPLLGLARYPVKFVLLIPLTVSILGAYGIRALEQKKMPAKNILPSAAALSFIGAFLLVWTHAHPLQYDRWPETLANCETRLAFFAAAIAAIYFWVRAQKIQPFLALLALLCLDGRLHVQNQNPTTDLKTLRGPIGSRPLPKLGEGRVFISVEAEKALLNSTVRDLNVDFVGKQLAVWSHLNLIELAPKVNGSATLQIRAQKEFQDSLYSGTNASLEASLDALGVAQITAAGSAIEFTNRATALPLVRFAANQSGNIRDVKFREHEITFACGAETNTTILVAQTWHPAWRLDASQPNRSVSTSPNNNGGPFQSFSLPAGQWAVRIFYDDKWFRRGTTVSLLVMFGLFYFSLSKRPARRL